MNESDEIKDPSITERNEKARKLYRYITDVARRIDEASTPSNSVADLFTTQIELLRQKLRDNCEKLIFLDPLNYGKKSLELLWRKVYYEAVSTSKKHRESDKKEEESFLYTHIICGIGHFHHLITKLQIELNVQHQELDYLVLNNDHDCETSPTVTEELQTFGKTLLYSCLIYLGDLNRYQVELFQSIDLSTSARYYLQAAHTDLSSGMPYNQLGNLYLDKNHNLDSVCYYIHCLHCESPFEGAMGNLTKLFEKNAQNCEPLNQCENVTQYEHVQSTIAQFISLIETWYLNKDDNNIPQRCGMITQQLKLSLSFEQIPFPDINKNYHEYTQATEEESINPSWMNVSIIHNMVQICLFTVAKVSETDEKKAFACKAFTLALLSQLIQKLLSQLKSFGFVNPATKFKRSYLPKRSSKEVIEENHLDDFDEIATTNDIVQENKNETDNVLNHTEITDPNDELIAETNDSKSKKSVLKRRRRRRCDSSDSSDISDNDPSGSLSSQDQSESEDFSESCYESDDVLSEGDEEEVETQNHNGDMGDQNNSNEVPKLNGDIKQNGNIIQNDIRENEKETNKLKELEIQNFLRGDNFLPSIKLLQDWILNEKELILSCGESGESLFQCVVDLLNIFMHYFKKNSDFVPETCKVMEYAKHLAKSLDLEYKTIPLPEDVNLRGTAICKFDKDAAEWQHSNRYRPSVYEENIIRILNFIGFGNQIANLVPRIRFNRTMQILYLKKLHKPKVNTKINHKKSREWHNSKTPITEANEGGLLKRLGKLWLASRVRELERYGRAPAAPTLLVLDTAALHKHLRRVKQLMRSRLFIILVPTIVLQELDDLKKEHSTARDAIRWLETQLRSGSRFLRAQRPGQSRPLPLLKYPRKAPPHIHNFIQILEFCHHFLADEKPQGGNGDPDNAVNGKSTPLLVLLTGIEPGSEEQYKNFSLTGAAQSASISIEYIHNFYTKWRHTTQKNGKKR